MSLCKVFRPRWALTVSLFCVLTSGIGCGGSDEAQPSQSKPRSKPATALPDLYDPKQPLEIEVDLAEEDWELLRAEGRSLNQNYSGCLPEDFEYTYVRSDVRVNGTAFPDTAIRKKGYLGSLSMLKPSLRLDFARYQQGREAFGIKDLTLNNSRSDPSYLRQCLAYKIFERAGIAASRCSFARVALNGSALGLYVNVEPVKKPFLRRAFGNDAGNLYEGMSGADFRPGKLERFEKKTHEDDPDHSELDAIAAVLETASDADLESALVPLLDIDQFLRFWAVETLVSHWDGYTGDVNNYLVYRPSDTGKVMFIPWGTDGAFQKVNPFLPAGQRPGATFAWAALPNRLFAYAPTRARYHEVLLRVLDEVWDEAELLGAIDELVAALGGEVPETAIMPLRDFVLGRRAEIERELAEPEIPWTLGEKPLRICRPETLSHVTGRFTTTWGTPMTGAASSTVTLELSVDGEAQVFESLRAGAGVFTVRQGVAPSPAIRLVGRYSNGKQLAVHFGFGGHPVSPETIPFHGFETLGSVALITDESMPGTVLGYIGEGSLMLERADATPGAPVEGSFDGSMVRIGTTRP